MSKQVSFQSGAKITKQVLDHQVDTGVERDLERFSDVNNAGVVKGSLNELDLIAGSNSTDTSPSVTVRTGIAYDSTGERILVDNESITYDANQPNTTTADGLGGNTTTPQSTGSLNVPLTADTTNFVWIQYLTTTDPTAFTVHKVTGQKLFYKRQDGYKIAVNTSSVTPPAGFDATALLLGSVITDSALANGISTISTTGRPLFGTKGNRVRVKTARSDKADVATTYPADTTIFVDDHIRAVGGGVATPTNPHGLTAVDIGITDPGGATHQDFLHADGIVSTSITGNASALFMQEHTSGIASQNFVEIFPLVADEVAVVAGVTFTSTDIPSTVQFFFVDDVGTPLPDGTHVIYLDSNDKSVKRALPGTFSGSDPTLRKIWEIDWANPSLNGSSKVDRRVFGTLNNNNMRFELLGGLITGAATGNRGITITYDAGNDDRIQSVTVSGDNGTIAGNDTTLNFAYDAPGAEGKLTSVTASYGNRTLTTTLSYNPDGTLNTITETVT